SSERFILSFSSNPNRILSLPPASGSACRRRRVSFFHSRFRICFVVPSLLYHLVVGPGLTSLQMLERLSTAVEFWLVLESRHGGTELLCAVESAFQGCGSQSFVISVLGGGKWQPSRSKCVDEVRSVSFLVLMVGVSSRDSYKFRRDYRKLATLETTWEFPASEAMRRTPPSYGLVDGRKRPSIPKDSKY
ncbi:hypothetical protein HID58_055265, partial [Brassica napus]